MKKYIIALLVFLITFFPSFGKQICMAFDFPVAVAGIQRMINQGFHVVCFNYPATEDDPVSSARLL